jgi:hypothetical protein
MYIKYTRHYAGHLIQMITYMIKTILPSRYFYFNFTNDKRKNKKLKNKARHGGIYCNPSIWKAKAGGLPV